MASGDASVATSASKKKKKKKKNVFKSLVKGMAFKKKKKYVDDETVVGVALDSNASSSGSKTAKSTTSQPAKPIQIVLLLMDPNSRRFELLQLEFDANKALVYDVVSQVQTSATEETLRKLKYGGICDQDGLEMIESLKLSNFCDGNEIVMAIPEGMTGAATIKLARPILSDQRVVDMLRPCGVKIKKIIKSNKSENKMEKIVEEGSKEEKAPATPKQPVQKTKAKSKTPSLFGLGIMALLFFTVLRHVRVTKKIESGDSLLPGQWKSQCGFWDVLPEKLSEKYCNTKSSLELGRDGTLRYYNKGGKGGEKIESWILSGKSAQCEDDESGCVNGDNGDVSSATFVKNGNSWYVDLDGKRTTLRKDVVKDFMTA